MNVIISDIPNVVPEIIDQTKVDFANKIIAGVHPLFDEVFVHKKEQVEELKKELRTKKKKIREDKEQLEILFNEYKRKQKINKLLDRVSKLVSSGLVSLGGMRNETVVLLKVIEKLSDEKLDYHLAQTLSTISKRFAK